MILENVDDAEKNMILKKTGRNKEKNEERGLNVSSHAADYCENLCWFEAGKTCSY